MGWETASPASRMALLLVALFCIVGVAPAPAVKVQLESYDEAVAAQYIWVAQATGTKNVDDVLNWTCGIACDTLKDVHNVHVAETGLPLQTRALVAEFGADECLLSFRGSKTVLNYLLDDFNIRWLMPYPFCKDCKVHKGFYVALQSLREQILASLTALGCDKKTLRVTGHSLGAAMAVMAAFELVGNYTLKHVYTYGQPRAGNDVWVDTFQNRLAEVPYFRITNYMDAVPHLPPNHIVGYRHPGPEVFYNATKMGSYRICPSGEDPSCSDQYSTSSCLGHTCCHCAYLGMNPCDDDTSKPRCLQPKGTFAMGSVEHSSGQAQIVV